MLELVFVLLVTVEFESGSRIHETAFLHDQAVALVAILRLLGRSSLSPHCRKHPERACLNDP